MQNVVKVFLGSAIFVSGGALGYFLAKKKYLALANFEVNAVKEKLEEYYTNKPTEVKEEPIVKHSEVKITQTSSIDGFKPETEEKYNNYAKQYQTKSVEEKVKANKEATTQPEKIEYPNPYVINNDTYALTTTYITKTVNYYIVDEILTDENNRKIDDYEKLVGKDFKKYISTEDFVYVRNEELKTDFDIKFETKRFSSIKTTEMVIVDPENE